jgi:arylsulfatase A-like enzyme
MATVAELLKVELPPNAAEDSFSLLPWLVGGSPARPVRDAVVHHAGSGKFAIRRGDWVLIDSPTGDDNGERGEPQWLMQKRGYTRNNDPGQLFNVREDLSERKSSYGEKPEIVRELKQRLEKYKADGRSTPGPVQQNDAAGRPFAAKPAAPR